MKNFLQQLKTFFASNGAGVKPVKKGLGFTTTNEEPDECLHSSAPSAVGANSASLKKETGFTILYAVITIAAVITIGVTITGVYQRQALLTTSSEASTRAFYAADAALECALKWDNRNENEFADGASTIECAGDDSVSVNDSCSGDCDYYFKLDDTGDANICAEVVIDKQGTGSSYDQVVATSSDATDIYDIDVGGIPYRVFEFENDGTFTVLQRGEVEYLVVGGGGGGGVRRAGGGGAGDFREGSQEVTTGDKNVVVGEGGRRGINDNQSGNPGEDSSFAGVIAAGGGFGGGQGKDGGDGGSGGGGGKSASGGSGTGVQGNDGGAGGDDGGGGGGAGEAGFSSLDPNRPGEGGNGLQSSITGATPPPYYAGGGAGGEWNASGGLGGGGDEGEDGVDGLGGGGGGEGGFSPGGDGGDGIVIVRYPLSDPDGSDDPVPTQIEARGRNTCEVSDRQAERALRTAY